MKIIQKILKSDFLKEQPPVLIDIGASGEINARWKEIAPYSICIAFDADDREFHITEQTNKSYKKLITFNRIVTATPEDQANFYLTHSPFCSSLLEPAAAVLAQALASVQVQTPAISVINNVDVAAPTDPEQIKDALVRQAWHPVRWVETIQAMKAQGVTHVVECGPGKVLTGLIKRIDRDLVALSISDPASLQATLEALEGA